ncbi:hypothetical protein TREMEDRAFT_26438, partial [Tremella mesenterica DSM 1558]|uniref:uncharacterized protein n=1 Tax=Tremella mesenterica (strain ATCC 24925 / CBS 8224 / DSM 1558 / NBRC 9311 / NRRL Y-6157 / RJB 2259-6 / UBC 559-6) TaxID=578456 RepID=UPI0003F49F4F
DDQVVLRYKDAYREPDLSDLPVLYPETVTSSNVGKVVTLHQRTFQNLKEIGLPKRILKELSESGGPAWVIRQATLDLKTRMEIASSSKKVSPLLLAGDKGSGKTFLHLHATAYALESDWIVLSIPRASEWVSSIHAYEYHSPTKIFRQPTLAADLLNRLLQTSEHRLARIPTGQETQNLAELAKSGTGIRADSSAVLEEVIDILADQTQFPVLFAIDEAQVLFGHSTYRNPRYEILQAYNLSIPLLALDFLTGKRAFKRGLTLASISRTTPDFPVALPLSVALDLPIPPSHAVTPYTKIDPIHLANASAGMNKLEVGQMSGKEAAGLFTLFARKGWVTSSDELFTSCLMASSGNAGEFVRGLRNTLQAFRQPQRHI